MQNEYAAFIGTAYGISLVALAGLALWVYLDARAQKRALKGLEERGIRRRSHRAGPTARVSDTEAESTR